MLFFSVVGFASMPNACNVFLKAVYLTWSVPPTQVKAGNSRTGFGKGGIMSQAIASCAWLKCSRHKSIHTFLPIGTESAFRLSFFFLYVGRFYMKIYTKLTHTGGW